jgi:hypothetical protein
MINKDENFQKDILNVLHKYGYRTCGITKLSMLLEVEELPRIEISYQHISHGLQGELNGSL